MATGGAGKSSVLKMVQASLEGQDGTLCLWFNGWAFEGFDDAKTVVIETVVDELVRARPATAQIKAAATKLRNRIDWLKIARKTGGLALSAVSGFPTPDLAADAVKLIQGVISNPGDTLSIEKLKDWASTAGEYVKDAPDEGGGMPAHMHAFRDEFISLLDAAGVKRLVVMVDDLDRCLPATAISTLEAIRLFLFVERTAFIIGADEMMIEYAVREHFPDLPPASGPVSYARNYLEKLIQVPFRIPSLGAMETRVYVALLLAENALGKGDKHFGKLLDVARDQLKRPWLSQGLDRTALEEAMGTVPPKIEQALVTSAQVSAVLSEGAHGNPRQIKRFLNTLMLREAIAEERGFHAEIDRQVLAKIMLAERFSPDFYGEIAKLAAGSKDGKPKEIAALETHRKVRAAADDVAGGVGDPTGQETPALPDPVVEEWVKSEWTLRWAKTNPPLAQHNLHPYVFVTRDKRSFFGGAAAHHHLEALVEKLTGPPLAIAQAEGDLKKLTGVEPETVFEAVRDQILLNADLMAKPRGVDGLSALVVAHPDLQGRLAGFLEALPADRVGGWVVSSWGRAFQDANVKQRFDELKTRWQTSGSSSVQAYLKAAPKITRL